MIFTIKMTMTFPGLKITNLKCSDMLRFLDMLQVNKVNYSLSG